MKNIQFSARRLPWTKLGTVIDEKKVSVERALELADLDWDVTLEPIYRKVDGKLTEIPDRFASTRSTDQKMFGVVGSHYATYQNRDAFAFLDDTGLDIVSAGQLNGGATVFAVAALDKQIEVVDGDFVDLYALIRAGHDGLRAIQVMELPIRGMCMNQLGQRQIKGVHQMWSVQHVSTMEERLKAAAAMLTRSDEYADALAASMRELAAMKITLADSKALLEKVVPKAEQEKKPVVQTILRNLDTSETIPDASRRTAWGLLNATTEYYDWLRPSRTDTARFKQSTDGAGARARNLLLSHLG